MVRRANSAWLFAFHRPRVREYLVRHQEVTFDEYADAFSLSFDLNWPYSENSVILVEDVPGKKEKRFKLNLVFEEHIRNMNNWTVGPRYWQHYPDLGKAIDEDRREFGGKI
jgi:hypothetical protein